MPQVFHPFYRSRPKRTIERAVEGVVIEVCSRDFEHALETCSVSRPDLFIVDLYEGEYVPETLKGPAVCKQIWDKRFRPLIVHSAFEADPHLDHRLSRHPFYKYVGKNAADCADQVAAQVKEFLSHAAVLRDIEDEVHGVLQIVIQETAETVWTSQTEPSDRGSALMRSARRRVGAQMDLKPFCSEDILQPWEQYIVPPLEADLLMGDLLREKGADPQDISKYRVVLTPSCDLVQRGGKGKVPATLVGKCVRAEESFQAAKLPKADKVDALKEQLKAILTQAQYNGYCPLPGYLNLWPEFAIKLRDTEFIAFADVLNPERRFERVASIDSPFREQIAWAHMQIASRPALLDRDVTSWVNSILSSAGVKLA